MKNEIRTIIAAIVVAALAALMVAGMILYPNTEECDPKTRAASRCAIPSAPLAKPDSGPADNRQPYHTGGRTIPRAVPTSDPADSPISVAKDGNR